jgi:hypothetical protein
MINADKKIPSSPDPESLGLICYYVLLSSVVHKAVKINNNATSQVHFAAQDFTV